MKFAQRIRGRRPFPAGALLRFVALLLAVAAARGASADEPALAREMLAELGERSGLCLHLGFRDTALTAALSDGGKYLVHGLSRDRRAVDAGREAIRSQGLLGSVSVEYDPLDRLPHADDLVNLLVIEDLGQPLDDGGLLGEALRVLRPGGVAFLRQTSEKGKSSPDMRRLNERLAKAGVAEAERKQIGSSAWLCLRKPRPASMDDWTHPRYDATRNPVSQDQVDVPTGVRWVAGPNWPTGNRKAAVPAVVASKDRLVYVFDDEVQTDKGPKRQKTLMARDAFNGLLLWKRPTSGASPAVLLHLGDRVYNVVEEGGPLVALDAASGEVVQTYAEAGRPAEVGYVDGRLLVRTRSDVRCLDAVTGQVQWEYDGASEMVAGDEHVYLQTSLRSTDGERAHGFVALELASGREVWRSSTEDWPKRPGSLSLVLYQDGALVFAGSGNHAISAKDGAYLWSYDYSLIGHGGSYSKVAYIHGLLWVHNAKSKGAGGKSSNAWEGLDPRTGKVKEKLPHGAIKHRCMHDVATQRYFLCGSMDFVDLDSQAHTRFSAARNSCQRAGAIPANGLVYTFPHGCACYPMLRGFLGLAAEDDAKRSADAAAPAAVSQRHEKGPAWGAEPAGEQQAAAMWPTYRADPKRSGSIDSAGPVRLKMLWSRDLCDIDAAAMRHEWDHKDGSRLTGLVVAEGLVFAAAGDTHELAALDADTGKTRWIFTAGGRIDCPPTLHRGLCLFGARDGWVYCLRAADGQLIWRYRAAPHDRRIVAYGQLESAWPVVGGVLVHDGLAYFAAGRHAAADGGVHVYAAQPAMGSIVWHSNPPGFNTLPDVLVARGGQIHMADWQFDAKTGEDRKSGSDRFLRSARLGLLNDAWYRRPIAMRKNLQQWSTGKESGQILAFNDDWTCGFEGAGSVAGGDGKISGNAELFGKPLHGKGRGWSRKLPLGTQIKGMVLAEDTLYIAGRLEGYDEKSNAVRALAVKDGATLAQFPLGEPLVHECLSVAGGRLYAATQSGRIVCLGEQ